MSNERRVALECATNTRDLGGVANEDGGVVRRGLVFRTDAVITPSDADRQVLLGLGLRHCFDFRTVAEIEALGANDLGDDVVVATRPLFDDGTAGLSEAIVKALRGEGAAQAEAMLSGGRSQQWSEQGPTRLVRRPVARATFGEIIRLLATEEGAPLIFNCSAGKDRTGVFAALLLRLLRVSEDEILEDYLLSNECRAASNAATYERLGAIGLDIELIRPLLEQNPVAIPRMFRAIDDDFGDFEAFVRDGLDVGDGAVRVLREKLLT